MADSIKAGTKRPLSTSDTPVTKRQRVHRRLQHGQKKPKDIEPACQDPVSIQGQLMRNLTAALTLVGFDGVKPTALEMFRAVTEEYMLHFLRTVRTSMHSSRRTAPTAQDFIAALARTPNAASASLLAPQLSLDLPASISAPPIPLPDPPLSPPPDFSALLHPLMTPDPPPYIPAHFPGLPPRHAWRDTAVLPHRELDARKMREKAMEEGLLAEQALRKLAAAAKIGAARAERRRESTLPIAAAAAARGREVLRLAKRRKLAPSAEEMYAEVLREVSAAEAEGGGGGGGGGDGDDGLMELGLDGAGAEKLRERGVDLDMPEGVIVNYEMAGWRQSGRKGLRL